MCLLAFVLACVASLVPSPLACSCLRLLLPLLALARACSGSCLLLSLALALACPCSRLFLGLFLFDRSLVLADKFFEVGFPLHSGQDLYRLLLLLLLLPVLLMLALACVHSLTIKQIPVGRLS